METGKQRVTRAVKGIIVAAVADGLIEPDDALAALVAVAATMVGQVQDVELRRVYVDHVLGMFPSAVAYAAGDRSALVAHEAHAETLQ